MPLSEPSSHPVLKQNWHYTLEVVTPLHVGSGGDPLRKDRDFIVTSRDVVVLDAIRTFERIYERALTTSSSASTEAANAPLNAIAAALQGAGLVEDVNAMAMPKLETPTAQQADVLARLEHGMTPQEALDAGWLTPADLRGNDSIVLYRLKPLPGVGLPLPQRLEPPEILPCSKTPAGQPYVPGSSIKGALRTVLAAMLFRGWPQPFTLQDVQSRGRPNPKTADDQLEEVMFGRDPNHDWLRALHVGDTEASGTGPELVVSGLYSLRGNQLAFKEGFYNALEVLPVGAQAQGLLRVDNFLFTPDVAVQLGFGPQKGWLQGLTKLINTHARSLITAEIGFYSAYGLPKVAEFYAELLQRLNELPPHQALVQMSWGTGWLAKTMGPALATQEMFPAIQSLFRMGRSSVSIFPKTRRLTLESMGYTRPGVPFGWVLLTLDEQIYKPGLTDAR